MRRLAAMVVVMVAMALGMTTMALVTAAVTLGTATMALVILMVTLKINVFARFKYSFECL